MAITLRSINQNITKQQTPVSSFACDDFDILFVAHHSSVGPSMFREMLEQHSASSRTLRHWASKAFITLGYYCFYKMFESKALER